MSYSYRGTNYSENPSSTAQNSDGSTVIRRTLVEHGIRPVDDNNSSNGSRSTVAAIAAINEQHKDEKRELQDLNAKFAIYLDRVQYLEDRNQRLSAELHNMKQHWGEDANDLQANYGPQLQALRRDLDQAIQDQALNELQFKRHDYDTWQLQEQIAIMDGDYDAYHLNQLKQELDASILDLEQIRNHVDKFFIDLQKLKSLYENSFQDVNSLKNELDNQQLERIIIDNELQTLREHVAFQKSVFQVQRADMLSLNTPVIDVSSFYRTELAHAISDIRRDFEVLFQTQSNELEAYYQVKTELVREEIETENERKRLLAAEGAIDLMDPTTLVTSIRDSQNELFTLQDQNKNLQAELDAMFDDIEKLQSEQLNERESYDRDIIFMREEIGDKQDLINSILDNNVSLRFEMSTYRGLLLAEEQHLSRMQQPLQTQSISSTVSGSSSVPSEGITALVPGSSSSSSSSSSSVLPPTVSTLTTVSSSSSSPSSTVTALASGLPTTITTGVSSSSSSPSSTVTALASGLPTTITTGVSTLASGSPLTLPSASVSSSSSSSTTTTTVGPVLATGLTSVLPPGVSTSVSSSIPSSSTVTALVTGSPATVTTAGVSTPASGSPTTNTTGVSSLASGSPITGPAEGVSTSVSSSSSLPTTTATTVAPSTVSALATGLSSAYQNKPTSNAVRDISGTKKMTVQKIARGPISFDSVDLETDAIVLVNERYGGSEQSFQNWSIRRQIDQQPEITYRFPATFSLRSRQTIRIFSKHSSQLAKSVNDGLVAEEVDTWNIGQHMITRLIDDNNEEKAIITQIFQ